MVYLLGGIFVIAQIYQGFLIYCLVLERTASQQAIQAASTRNRVLCMTLETTLNILAAHYPLRNEKQTLSDLSDSISKLHVQP